MGQELEQWLALTLAGFTALRAGEAQDARENWRRSQALATGGALRHSPLHAVACNNAMVGEALVATSDAVMAEGLSAAWSDVSQLASDADMPLPARSTAFHLRLASRHARPYAAFLGARAQGLAMLGRQIGEANALYLCGRTEDATARLRALDQTQAQLPGFLDAAQRVVLAGALGPLEAADLLDRQLAHLRSYRSGGGLPDTFWRQMESALDFCAFAPCALAHLRPSTSLDHGELEV